MNTCIALMVAAPASAQGKTSISSGLAKYWRDQGCTVRAFKWGPDFLDPSWLAAATKQAVDNLDLAMCGTKDVQQRLSQAAQASDVLLIESAMGLFDGDPSPADLAQRFDIPILLVIDASHMAETFGALVHGLANFRPGLRFAGVVANRVSSARHLELLQRGMSLESGGSSLTWLGGIPRQAKSLPSRHLGLVASDHAIDVEGQLQAMARAIATTPLGQTPWQQRLEWQVAFPCDEVPASGSQPDKLMANCIVAIARDAAFSFIYSANVNCLQAMGAEIRWFSPLNGDALPACDALWLPGGYPELHAKELAQCTRLAKQIKVHVSAGKPVWAECGGMVALMDAIHWPSQNLHQSLWGVLPGQATQHDRLQGLGMQAWLSPDGLLKGHGFHYSSVACHAPVVARTQRLRDENTVSDISLENIYQFGSVHASYFHAWFPSNPRWVARLLGGSRESN